MVRRPLVLIVLGGVVVASAACGDSDDDRSSSGAGSGAGASSGGGANGGSGGGGAAVALGSAEVVWANGIGGPNYDLGQQVTTCADGTVYATGFGRSGAVFGAGTPTEWTQLPGFTQYLAAYDSDGALKWVVPLTSRLGSGNMDIEEPLALPDCSVVLSGAFSPNSPGSGVDNTLYIGDPMTPALTVVDADFEYYTPFLARIDAAGTLVWAIVPPEPVGPKKSGPVAFLDGQIILSGTSLVAFDLDGSQVWEKPMPFGVDGLRLEGATTTNDDNLLIVGSWSASDGTVIADAGGPNQATFEITNDSEDVFVAAFDSQGEFLWAGTRPGSGLDIGYAVGALPDGSAVIAANLANNRGYFARFDASGALWEKVIDGKGVTDTRAMATHGTSVFAAVTLTDWESNAPLLGFPVSFPEDVFGIVVSYNEDGEPRWVEPIENGGATGIATAEDGSVVVTGAFSETATFGDDPGIPLTETGEHDAYVAKLVEE